MNKRRIESNWICDDWLLTEFNSVLENCFLILPTGEQKWLWMVFGQMIRQLVLRSEALSGWQKWITKAVWRKPRADKEPVFWSTGQRLGLGCLRLVPADPPMWLSYSWYSDVSNPYQHACFSFSPNPKLLKHCGGVTTIFHFKMLICVFCLPTLSSTYLCNQPLPFFHRWPIFPNMAC